MHWYSTQMCLNHTSSGFFFLYHHTTIVRYKVTQNSNFVFGKTIIIAIGHWKIFKNRVRPLFFVSGESGKCVWRSIQWKLCRPTLEFKHLCMVYPARTRWSHFDVFAEKTSWKFVTLELSYFFFLVLRVINVFTTYGQRVVSAYVLWRQHRRLTLANLRGVQTEWTDEKLDRKAVNAPRTCARQWIFPGFILFSPFGHLRDHTVYSLFFSHRSLLIFRLCRTLPPVTRR